jgi:hypothetical protein
VDAQCSPGTCGWHQNPAAGLWSTGRSISVAFFLQGVFIQSLLQVVLWRIKPAHSQRAEITVHSVIDCAVFMSTGQSALHNSSELPSPTFISDSWGLESHSV